jgi:hypothetical protein
MRVCKVSWAIVVATFWTPLFPAMSENSVPTLARELSELPPESSVLDLPEGVYTIGSTWTISKPGIVVRGAGPGKTILVRDPNFQGVLVRMDAERSTLSDLTLDGAGTPTILFLNRSGVTADTLEVKNFTHIGIAVPGQASDCRITKCVINGPSSQSTMAIWHDAGRNPTDSTIMIDHNVIKNTGLYGTGGRITIADNQISGEPNPGGGQMDIGNAYSTNTVGVITGNTVMNGGTLMTGGIELGGGSFTVANNTVRNHGLAGIGIGHNVVQAEITDNIISNSGQNTTDKHQPQCRSAIYVGYGATNIRISGNRCFDDQPNKTQTWGVILVSPPAKPDPRFAPKATEHIFVTNNDLRGNLRPEGLLDESRARDRRSSGNLPPRANR